MSKEALNNIPIFGHSEFRGILKKGDQNKLLDYVQLSASSSKERGSPMSFSHNSTPRMAQHSASSGIHKNHSSDPFSRFSNEYKLFLLYLKYIVISSQGIEKRTMLK